VGIIGCIPRGIPLEDGGNRATADLLIGWGWDRMWASGGDKEMPSG